MESAHFAEQVIFKKLNDIPDGFLHLRHYHSHKLSIISTQTTLWTNTYDHIH